jgi:riboflavin biosynthesis pyrimidine reductase
MYNACAMTEPNTNRPETTLLLSLSVDGRITSHDSDAFDPDKTWKTQPGIRAILQQFYNFSQSGATVMTTGVFMNNLGVNTRQNSPQPEDLNLIVLDPDADLTPSGITYLARNVHHLFLVCLKSHPALTHLPLSCTPLSFPNEIDLNQVFTSLKKHQVKQLLIHSIAPLNADLLDAGLIDHLSIIISPLLVGGHGTPALQDADILAVRPLTLTGTQVFSQNFVNLRYDVG